MIFRKRAEVLTEWFGQGLLLLDVNTNLPYVLNEAASCILKNTDGRRDQASIARKVCEAYDVGFAQALGDVKKLHETLQGKNIIQQVK